MNEQSSTGASDDATGIPAPTPAVEAAATTPFAVTGEPGADQVDAESAFRAKRKHRRVAALSIAAAVIFTAGAGGGSLVSLALARSTTATSAIAGGSTSQQGTAPGQGTQNGFGGTSGGFGGPSSGFGSSGSASGSSGSGTGSGTGSSTSTSTAATADQISGLVTIVSQLGYEDGESAGTGIILTSSGRILTNNHVIDGATAIKVTDETTGTSYTAKVVGTNATKDIAVLQLENASGLTTADLSSTAAKSGDAITAVGNANGTGTLSAAAGSVAATGQTITTQAEGATAGETLHGLIELDADVVSGDSGGAVKNATGDVVGVTTAASSGTADVTGYAIPIASALSVASQIVAGDDTAEITLGLPAFLGVAMSTTGSADGAVIGSILDGTPAASSALAAGDTITAIDGTAVSSNTELSAAIATHKAGDRVTVSYTDAKGASHTATVTLTEGPAN